MEETEQLACADKISFDAKAQAEGAAVAANWQHDISSKAYKCRHCHLWHLSSNFE